MNTDAKIIQTALDQVHDLLALRWGKITELAEEEGADGQATVGVTLRFDFRGKTPACKYGTSFASRVKDEGCCRLDDPDQTKLPLENGDDVKVTVTTGGAIGPLTVSAKDYKRALKRLAKPGEAE